ncbi:hypothetical protein [Spirillospora albida]|uniref:hypothetical protein n=1 Tax=Spirillospora albida TaxID=58123 RepID=UPI0012F88FA1|nr:hypothetical protein [Spirillospora albida]
MAGFGFSYGGHDWKIPAGLSFCYHIEGDKRTYTSQKAYIARDLAGLFWPKFWNWSINFAYYDDRGRRYYSTYGKIHNDGAYKPSRSLGRGTFPKYGKACANFNVVGKERAKQCHYIHA